MALSRRFIIALMLCMFIASFAQSYNEHVSQVYVAQRPLGIGIAGKLLNKNRFRHSAILAKTPNCYQIIEYLSDSKVHVKVPTTVMIDKFQADGFTWHKQAQGVPVTQSLTVGDIRNTMENL